MARKQGRVYLVHFDSRFGKPRGEDTPYAYAGHYLGYAWDADVERRFKEHVAGEGSRLLAALVQAGVGFQVVRTWKGTIHAERALKRLKNSRTICPACNPKLRRRKTRKYAYRFEPASVEFNQREES